MDNEVRIHVVADDDVDKGFTSAKQKTRRFTDDVDTEVRKIAPKVGDGLGGGMLSGLRGTLPSFGQFGGIIGGIMAPTLGAAVSAGIMGGAGGAGILGGLILASKDSAVQAAGANLKKEIGDDLKEAASSFIPVALSSLGRLRGAFKDILPDQQSIFTTSSRFVDPLLDGVISGGKRIVSGIRAAVDGAQPVFESFGRLAGNIGDAVGDLFEGVADDGDAAASAVDDLSGSITNMIRVTGTAINALTEIKGKFDDLDAGIDSQRYKLEDSVSWLDITADGYEKGSEAAKLYRDGVICAAGSTNDYTAYLKDQKGASDAATASTKNQTSALRELADEMLAQTDPLFGMIDAQKEYTEALKKHGPRSSEAREALNDLGKAAFALQDKVGDAAGGFDGRLTPAMRTALRNAGLTTGQMDKLERQLREAATAAQRGEGAFEQTF